jgi:hypothetical protein
MSDRASSAGPQQRAIADLGDVANDALHLLQPEYALARQATIETITPAVRSLVLLVASGALALLGGAAAHAVGA